MINLVGNDRVLGKHSLVFEDYHGSVDNISYYIFI